MQSSPAGEPHFLWHFSGASESATPPAAGSHFGPYEVLSELGSGGMGAVLRVKDATGRELALKLLTPKTGTEAETARLRREGEITASLRHPGIVNVHGAGQIDGRAYLLYELVEGTDLEQALKDLPRARVLQVIRDVALALGYAHAKGVVHRDVKPSNVLLDLEGRAHLADFGLAQGRDLERLTQTGTFLGTPSCMAPEQVACQRSSYGPQTDVWALGTMLYRGLTGRAPFECSTLTELMAAIVGRDPEAPDRLDPSIPKQISAVCLKAMSKSIGDRHSDGTAFAEDLSLAMAGLREVPRRARWGWVAAGLVGAVGLVGGLYALRVPTDQANAALKSHVEWERRALTPLALGLLGGDSLDEAELNARMAALQPALELLPAKAQPHADRLNAYTRVLRTRRGETVDVPPTSSDRAAVQLTADALILRAQGRAAQARSRLERALRREPKFRPARLAQFVSLAEDNPPALINSATDGDPEAAAVLETAWRRLLVEGAATVTTSSAATDFLVSLAAALPQISAKERATAVRAAFKASSSGWRTALPVAFKEGTELRLLRRLEVLLEPWGKPRMGPALATAFAGALDQICAQGGAGNAYLVRLIRLESKLHYLCEEFTVPTRFREVLGATEVSLKLDSLKREDRFAIALALLRSGNNADFKLIEEVCPWPQPCREWLKLRPESRAGYALLGRLRAKRLRKGADGKALDEVIHLLHRATEAKDNDLAEAHLARTWVFLGSASLRRLSARAAQAEGVSTDPLLTEAIAHARSAGKLRVSFLTNALMLEHQAQRLYEGAEKSLSHWESRLQEFEALVGEAGPQLFEEEPISLQRGKLLIQWASDLESLGRLEQSWDVSRRAFLAMTRDGRASLTVAPGWRHSPLAGAEQLTRLGLASGNEELTVQLLEGSLPALFKSKGPGKSGMSSRALGCLVVSLRRLGRQAEATALLTRARQEFPKSAALREPLPSGP